MIPSPSFLVVLPTALGEMPGEFIGHPAGARTRTFTRVCCLPNGMPVRDGGKRGRKSPILVLQCLAVRRQAGEIALVVITARQMRARPPTGWKEVGVVFQDRVTTPMLLNSSGFILSTSAPALDRASRRGMLRTTATTTIGDSFLLFLIFTFILFHQHFKKMKEICINCGYTPCHEISRGT